MPTMDELRAEAEKTGVDLNTLLARAVQAGTLTSEPVPEPVETEPALKLEYKSEPVSPGTVAGLLGMPTSAVTPELVGAERAKGRKLAGEVASGLGFPTEILPEQPEPPVKLTPEETQALALRSAQTVAGGLTGMPLQQIPPEAAKAQPALLAQPPGFARPGFGAGAGVGYDKPVLEAFGDVTEALGAKAEAGGLAAEQELGAIQHQKEVMQARAGAEADVWRTYQAERDKVIGEQQQREIERREEIDLELNKVRDAVEMVKSSKIDPYRFYRHPDGSTNYPKSVAAAIAVGMGALGASLPTRYGGTGRGGPNMALAIIDKAIDRDIAAQRDDIANQRAGVGMQMNLLGQMRANMTGERNAEAATRIAMWETAKIKLQRVAAESGSAEVAAKATAAIAEIEGKQQMLEANIGIQTAANGMQKEQFVRQGKMQRAQAAAAQRAAATKVVGEIGPAIGGFEPFRKVEKDERTKWTEVSIAYQKANKYVDRLIYIGKTYGREVLGTALSGPAKEAAELVSEATIALNVIARLGALSGHDLPLLQEPLPDPTHVWQTTHLDSLIRKAARLRATQKDTAEHYGFKPIQGPEEGAAL